MSRHKSPMVCIQRLRLLPTVEAAPAPLENLLLHQALPSRKHHSWHSAPSIAPEAEVVTHLVASTIWASSKVAAENLALRALDLCGPLQNRGPPDGWSHSPPPRAPYVALERWWRPAAHSSEPWTLQCLDLSWTQWQRHSHERMPQSTIVTGFRGLLSASVPVSNSTRSMTSMPCTTRPRTTCFPFSLL